MSAEEVAHMIREDDLKRRLEVINREKIDQVFFRLCKKKRSCLVGKRQGMGTRVPFIVQLLRLVF